MELILAFTSGYLLACLSAYIWYLVGRKTSYQDKNIVPPPNPIELHKITVVKEPEVPTGWVDDFTDPGMSTFKKGSEL